MNKTTLMIVIIVVALFGLLMVTIGGRTQSLSQQTSTVTPSPTVYASPAAGLTTSPTGTDLGAGGSSYRDSQGVYTLLYPNDYKQEIIEEGKYFRVYKTGATQQGQTEMYDGVIFHVETVPLNGQTLEQWVDAHIKTQTADGTSELIEPKKLIRVNNYPGFTYTMRGLGESKYTLIQKDEASDFAINITTAVNDPENVGFQAEVDAIFASIQMLK